MFTFLKYKGLTLTLKNFGVKTKDGRGFTLLEIVVVVGIMAVLSGIIVTSFSGFTEGRLIDVYTEEITSLLNKGRLDTIASLGGYQYGVHFESSRLVYFRGTTFTEPDVNNIEVTLDNALEISAITLTGGGADVVFERLSGITNQPGSIVMRVKNTPTKNVTITIDQTGVVGFNLF